MPLPRPTGRRSRPLTMVADVVRALRPRRAPRRWPTVALLLLATAAAGGGAGAQQTRTGTLVGRVVDDRGLAVPLATVAAVADSGAGAGAEPQAEAWRAARRTTADEAGLFRLAGLTPGRYRVRVQRVGYRAVIVTGAVVRAQQTTELRVVVPATAAELAPVVVAAPTVTIRREDTELGSVIGAESIELLPVGLDTRAIVAFTPGARTEAVWGGASAQANSYQLDGLAANHPGIGGRLVDPSVSWVEALEVKGLGGGAELGDFQGGVINVVTKSGTNRLRGAVRANVETHRLNGTNAGIADAVPELAGRRELDGEVGGPIVRDRLFFFAAGQYVERDTRVRDQLARLAPAGAGFADGHEERDDLRLFGKLSWQPGAGHLAHLTLLHADGRGEHVGRSGLETLEATRALRSPTTLGMLDWQLRGRLGELTAKLSASGTEERLAPYGGADVAGVATFRTVDPRLYGNAAFDEERRARTLGALASWRGTFGTMGLTHTLRVGAEMSGGSWLDRRARTGGLTWRPSTAARGAGNPFVPGDPATWFANRVIPVATGGDVHLDAAVRNAAAYVQDQVAIGSRVTLTPGVRVGHWSGELRPGGGGPRRPAVEDRAWEPRIGAIVDLTRGGSFVAKAHWGRYHQGMFAQLFDRVEGSDVFTNEQLWYYRGPAFADPGHSIGAAQWEALRQAGQLELVEEQVVNETGPALDYRQPYVDQLVLGLEKTFGSRWKAEARYVARVNRRMVGLVDRNLASNWTRYDDVRISHAGGPAVTDAHGDPLTITHLYVPNGAVREFLRLKAQGYFDGVNLPGFAVGDTATVSWDPDYVLTNVPGARRRFEQLQLALTTRHATWMASGSVVLTRLEGNMGTVTGYADGSGRGAGPWVRPNEQLNFHGPLDEVSEVEAKLLATGQLPWRLRGGAFLSLRSGDRTTPTFVLSGLHFDYAGQVAGGAGGTRQALPSFVTRPLAGQRLFVEPRGRYRHPTRWMLDLHLERAFPVRRAELVLAADVFNVFGENAVVRTNTRLDAVGDPGATSVYGAALTREPPRTVRVGTAVTF